MRKTKRIIAAVTAAIITAASASLMSVCAENNEVKKADSVSAPQADTEKSILQEYADDISSYMMMNSLAGYAFVRDDKVVVTYSAYVGKIKFYVDAKRMDKSVIVYEAAKNVGETHEKKKNSTLSDIAEDINEYMRSNGISGYTYAQIIGCTEKKLLIVFDGFLDKIQAYVAEKGIDESLVEYRQSRDDVIVPDKTDEEKTAAQKYGEAIAEYMANNDIQGVVSRSVPDEKLSIGFHGDHEEQLRAYISEIGLDESGIPYEFEKLPDFSELNDLVVTTVSQSTSATTTTSTSVTILAETVKGDANCDGQVDLSDVVMIMQALANPDKYGINGTAENRLTKQGKTNADMDGNGLTVGDAQAIQKMLLGYEK